VLVTKNMAKQGLSVWKNGPRTFVKVPVKNMGDSDSGFEPGLGSRFFSG
jgi:hypothetical protein